MHKLLTSLLLSLLFISSLHATTACEKTLTIQHFAQRFYTEALGREAEDVGLDYWTNSLVRGDATGVDIVDGFIFSAEFEAKNLNNTDFIQTLYHTLFNREADAGGLVHWRTKLEEGISRRDLVNALMYSQEFTALASSYGIKVSSSMASASLSDFVARFYTVVLGREADKAGLDGWVSRLSLGDATAAEIAKGFVFSVEYNEASKDNATLLTTLYRAFFNREPDSAGFNYWMSLLSQGLSREALVEHFLHSIEFINLANAYHIQAFEGAVKPEPFKGVAPVAVIKGTQTFSANQGLLLMGANSSDSDGAVVCYMWKEADTLLSSEATLSTPIYAVGTHNIRLTVIDNDGLSASQSVIIAVKNNAEDEDNTSIEVPSVDTTPPVLTLNGEASITLEQNTLYTELGATALDDRDGSVGVSISGSVDSATLGEYTVTYSAEDKVGNRASVSRTVKVKATVMLKSLSLQSSATGTVNVGDTVTLSVIGTYADNSSKTLTSNIEYLITPSQSVRLSANTLEVLKDGSVTVQATVDGVKSNTINLDITWVVNAHTLPPEPDKVVNDATLLGIDSNDNGVRDDVERWIYENYHQPIERGIFMQSARAYNKVIVDPSKAHETKKYSDNAVSCGSYWIYEHKPISFDKYKFHKNRKKLKDIQFNTLERHINYDKYQKALSGGVYNLLPKSKEKCEFDENGILGEAK